MKKLLLLILLLPLFANAQFVNGTLQKNKTTKVIRGSFGTSGIDNLVRTKNSPTNGQLLQYSVADTAWVPYTIPIDGATGIISGGTVTGLGGANAIVAAGTGTILDNTSPSSPALYTLSWVTDTIGLTDNTTNYLYYDSLGVLNATTTIPNPANFRTRVYLGRAQKASGVITSINGAYVPIQQTPATIKDMFTAYGLTKTGLVVSPASTNLTIAVASGGIFSFGANFQSSVLNPNNLSYTANSPQTFRMVTAGNISATDITVLPVGSYNPTGTTVSAIGGGANESTIFTVYKFPTTGNVRVLYGQTTYSSLASAVQSIGSYVPNPPAVFSDAIIIGYIAAVKTATDLSNTAQAVFVTTNKFGGVGGGFSSTALTNYVQKTGDTMSGLLGISVVDATGLNVTNNSTTNPSAITRNNGSGNIHGFYNNSGAISHINNNGLLQTATGTSAQFLKADGTVDSNTYLTTLGTSAISLGGTTNGLSYSSGNYRLHKVTETTGGVLTTGTDSIGGNKYFFGGLFLKSGGFAINANPGTTVLSGADYRNTGSSTRLGTESLAGGGIFTGTSSYASVFGSNGAYPLQFATNSTVRTTISTSGDLSNTGSISSTPQGTLYGTATGSITSSQLATSLTDETGTGSAVFGTSPTLTTSATIDAGTSDIMFGSTSNYGYASFNGSSSLTGMLGMFGGATGDLTSLYLQAPTGGALDFRVASLDAFQVNASGDIIIAGNNATKASGTAWINPSDLRLKMNVGDYPKGLAEILQIKPKTWYFNKASGFDQTKKHLSPIAQELQKIMPEMVSTYKGKLNGKEQELLQVDASDMTWLLVKAIQEQQAIIEKLNQRITLLEQK